MLQCSALPLAPPLASGAEKRRVSGDRRLRYSCGALLRPQGSSASSPSRRRPRRWRRWPWPSMSSRRRRPRCQGSSWWPTAAKSRAASSARASAWASTRSPSSPRQTRWRRTSGATAGRVQCPPAAPRAVRCYSARGNRGAREPAPAVASGRCLAAGVVGGLGAPPGRRGAELRKWPATWAPGGVAWRGVTVVRREATRQVCLGDNPRSYTNQALLLQIAAEQGVTAIHPG